MLFLMLFSAGNGCLFAQMTQGFIYGEIVLKNDERYQGQLRWEDEEALWNDIFNAYRFDLPIRDMLSEDQAKQIENRSESFRFGFMELWKDRSPDMKYAFHCNFGDLSSLQYKGDYVLATLKNGATVKLKMAGDLEEDIIIHDSGLGSLDIDPGDIKTIHFKPTPADLDIQWGAPVYARILTSQGAYEGYITWDSEECLGEDLISGERNGIDVDIKFKEIETLKAQDDGSIITLNSGRTIFLNDHDDVGPGNHGILIRNAPFGKIEVVWKNFISATFMVPAVSPAAYNDYKAPQILRGKIHSKSGKISRGAIIYDLDERYDNEFLNGDNSGFTYYIPFYHIDFIEPQNDKFTLVHLRDGEQFLLGNNGDVTSENQGVIVLSPSQKAEYIPWADIKLIDFE